MQAAKDTFLKTLAERLAAVNSARTLAVDGDSRPALLALENENVARPESRLESFLLSWEASGAAGAEGSLLYVDCTVSYASRGSSAMVGSDRGRVLTAMDNELRSICQPASAAKCDYTQATPAALETNIFWSRPALQAITDNDGALRRTATIRLFFFPEVG